MATHPDADCIVVGGGPAGLATALGLCRVLHTVLLFDSGVYRNRYAKHMHTINTWDHTNPRDYRAAARKELLSGRYKTVQIKDVALEQVVKLDSGLFKATDAQGKEWTARTVVLAVGSTDVFPDIPGYEQCWGIGVFHCLFCHGFEDKGAASAGVLAVGDAMKPAVVHFTNQALQFAQSITVYTHGSEEFTKSIAPLVAANNVKVDTRRIKELVKSPTENGELTIVFEDGDRQTVGFLVHKPKTVLNGPFAQQLGLQTTPFGDIMVTQPIMATSLNGVFAVGDCATMMKVLPHATFSGVNAAAGVSMQLLGHAH